MTCIYGDLTFDDIKNIPPEKWLEYFGKKRKESDTDDKECNDGQDV